MTWQTLAACRGLDVNLFFNEHGGHGVNDEAARTCATCPVRNACLDHALRYEEYGYFAGTTRKTRRALRRQLGITLENPQTVFYATEDDGAVA
jgi:WhiB family redox-sensing transcriptional regulator